MLPSEWMWIEIGYAETTLLCGIETRKRGKNSIRRSTGGNIFTDTNSSFSFSLWQIYVSTIEDVFVPGVRLLQTHTILIFSFHSP